MLKAKFAAAAALIALSAVTSLVPASAQSSNWQKEMHNRQQNKNTWRNVGIGAGVVAAHGLLRHNTTETVLGAAGAAYAAHRYEQDRHSQSQQRDAWRKRHYYHRSTSNRHHYYHHAR